MGYFFYFIFFSWISLTSALSITNVPEKKNLEKLTSDFQIPIDLESDAPYVLLVDFETGAVLLERNADAKMHPSSMTKIMTAYLAIEKIKKGVVTLDTCLPVSKNAFQLEGSSMFLNINDNVRVEDLLNGVIIQSGNDASVVLAEGLSGSEESFAREMTRRAKELGAKNTNFTNSTGLPQPDHQTTARDLALLALHVIRDHPEYYPIYGKKKFSYGKINQGNRNPLLYKNIGCDGIKTGYSEQAGYGLIASCVQDNRRLILVINGLSTAQARADEGIKLITWGFRQFENRSIPLPELPQIPLFYSSINKIPTMVESVIVTLPRGTNDLQATFQHPKKVFAPIKKGDVLGKVLVNSAVLKQPLELPLKASISVEKGGMFRVFWDILRSWL